VLGLLGAAHQRYAITPARAGNLTATIETTASQSARGRDGGRSVCRQAAAETSSVARTRMSEVG